MILILNLKCNLTEGIEYKFFIMSTNGPLNVLLALWFHYFTSG